MGHRHKQRDRLEGDGFTAGVGAADQQTALLPFQLIGVGNHPLGIDQRMTRLLEQKMMVMGVELGDTAIVSDAPLRLGKQRV